MALHTCPNLAKITHHRNSHSPSQLEEQRIDQIIRDARSKYLQKRQKAVAQGIYAGLHDHVSMKPKRLYQQTEESERKMEAVIGDMPRQGVYFADGPLATFATASSVRRDVVRENQREKRANVVNLARDM